MLRKNFPKRKKLKQEQALERNEAFQKLSVDEKNARNKNKKYKA